MTKLTMGVLAVAIAGCTFDDKTAATGDGSAGTTVDAGATTTTTTGDAATPAGSPDGVGFGNTVVAGGGAVDTTNPFFVALGTNGRSCATCHDQTTGWTVTPAALQARFAATAGDDPIFALVDGADSPTADVSTLAARQAAYRMLLTKGLIRIGLPLPANAEFTLEAVDDPYGFASAAELSLFRRPLPTTNLRFLSLTLWDGREVDLAHQATDATLGHEQAASADATITAQIVAFESALYTAQSTDDIAGALAGPAELVDLPFYLGINDSLGGDPSGAPFDRDVFDVYAAWLGAPGGPPTGPNGPGTPPAPQTAAERQQSIARGEQLFDTRPFQITNVDGIPNGQGSCSTCHDTPNVGDHSVGLLLNLGLTDAAVRTPDMPLYTLTNATTGQTVQTTDPGRALVTGQWSDVGKFKVPVLRAVAMRPPYFHNGFAPTLDAVVNFYDHRFQIHLSPQEHQDLVAFLSAL